MFFLFTFKNKEEQNVADLKKKFADFQEFIFFIKLKTFKTHFLKNFIIYKPSLWCPTKNLGPIGSVVLTFIEYKQTDRQAKFISRCRKHLLDVKYAVHGWERLLYSILNFKIKSPKLCRPLSLNKWFDKLLIVNYLL